MEDAPFEDVFPSENIVYQRVVFQAPGPFSKEFSFIRQAARAFCQLAALDTEGATGHTVLGAGALRQRGSVGMRVKKWPEKPKKKRYPLWN